MMQRRHSGKKLSVQNFTNLLQSELHLLPLIRWIQGHLLDGGDRKEMKFVNCKN